MPRRKFIDKKNATTFALVHRAQNDPLINDENASSMVFAEKATSQRRRNDDDAPPSSSAASMLSDSSAHSRKVKQRGDLEEEFGPAFRPNEGEAAQHGVFYDDTKYDYMQHMKDLGSGDGPVTWVEANSAQDAKKTGKGKQRLEDALRDMDLVGESSSSRFGDASGHSIGQSSMTSSAARSLLPEEVLPSEFVKKQTYQDQQDIPDEIAGFQPDMDPRLREVLEALEDEAYVDDEEDLFGQLTAEGAEVDRDEWERLGEQQMFEEGKGVLGDGEDEGWESDDTIKASSPHSQPTTLLLPDSEDAVPPLDPQAPLPADPTGGAWQDEIQKFKSDLKAAKCPAQGGLAAFRAPSALESSALSSLASGRRKKRRGAKTSTTNYSMTSSALARTDQQTLLDARFDRIEENYAAEEMAEDFDDAMSATSNLTGASRASKTSAYSRQSRVSGVSGVSGISSYSRATDSEAPQLERSDFNSIMDEFLGGYSTTGKAARRVRRGGPQTGMQQLAEVRAGLGPARVSERLRAS